MKSVGVGELRQDANVLLAQVRSTGEPVEITRHGSQVARLLPVATAVLSRSLDALHVAWAALLPDLEVLVTYDQRMAQAARPTA